MTFPAHALAHALVDFVKTFFLLPSSCHVSDVFRNVYQILFLFARSRKKKRGQNAPSKFALARFPLFSSVWPSVFGLHLGLLRLHSGLSGMTRLSHEEKDMWFVEDKTPAIRNSKREKDWIARGNFPLSIFVLFSKKSVTYHDLERTNVVQLR